MEAGINVSKLSKHYREVKSLQDCSFDVAPGTVFGLLGPNGAGKTTLIRMLLGFVKPTAGKATIGGFDIAQESLKVRSITSYLPGDARLYRGMTGRSVIRLFSGLHPLGNMDNALTIAKRLDLDISRRVMFMSTGMRQKLALSIVMGCKAPVLILDEPTANLDPNVRATVLELVSEAKREGRTVLLCSHIFSDIDETCDEVVILRSGSVVTQKSLAEVGKVHILRAILPPNIDGESFQISAEGHAAVTHFDLDTTSRKVVLHLRGEAEQWMPWILEQHLLSVEIERAGIRAVYDRFNQLHAADDISVAEGVAV